MSISCNEEEIKIIYKSIFHFNNLLDDSYFYLKKIINFIYNEIKKLGINQFIFKRLSNQLKLFLIKKCNNEITLNKIIEFVLLILFDESKKYLMTISSYDIILIICSSDDLYLLFEDCIPCFPYIDPDMFNISIEKNFGNINEETFINCLQHFLESRVSFLQNYPFNEVCVYIQKITDTKHIAPIIVYGEYINYVCNIIKKAFEEKFVDIKDRSKYNFLNLATIVNDLNCLECGQFLVKN